jgi:hypothetical protein
MSLSFRPRIASWSSSTKRRKTMKMQMKKMKMTMPKRALMMRIL